MKPDHIIIHHSLTADGETVSWEAIRRYHRNINGWDDIGYHFGIEAVGADGWLTVLMGRSPRKAGAHTLGMNGRSFGICVVGNFDVASPSDTHYGLCADLCAWLAALYGIPITNIRPHSDYARKTCPGTRFDMERLRREAAEMQRNWYADL